MKNTSVLVGLNTSALLGLILLFVTVLGFFVLIGWMIKEYIRKRRELANYDTPDDELGGDVDAVSASVVSRRGADEWSGNGKVPTYHLGMYVTFIKTDGSKVEYAVSEEIYKKCIPGTVGMLVTMNGQFFDFGDGEDVEAAE